MDKKKTGKPVACQTCYGHGMWAFGIPAPMGPMDAGIINGAPSGDGMPTRPCPECGADANPLTDSQKHEE